MAGARGTLPFPVGDRRTSASWIEVTVVEADRPHLFAFSWISPERLPATPDAVDWDDAAKAAYAAEHHEGRERFLDRLRAHAEGLPTHGSA